MKDLEDWYYKYNAWSFSRHRLWNLCKRAYYYRYIGVALKNTKEINVQVLKELKNLNSRFALQGKLIHEIIENQIGQHYLGRKMNENSAKSQYTQRIEQYRKMAKKRLTEYFNGEPIDERFFDNIRTEGIDQISMFFGVIWPQLEDLDYLRHERFDRFMVGNVEVIVKVDYVSKTKDGIIVVSDWKTGTDNEEYENDLQIGLYALWAMETYEKEPEEIKSELIYLTTGKMRVYEFSIEDLEEIKRNIIKDFEDMNRTIDIEYFHPDPHPKKCLSCQFATICPVSMHLLALENKGDDNDG